MCDSEFNIGNFFNKEWVKLFWGSYLALLQVVLKLECMFPFVVIDVELSKLSLWLMSCEDLELVLKAIRVEVLAGIKVILEK